MSLWLQWQAQFKRAKQPDLNKIRKRLLDQIEGKNIQQECNNMSNILNQIIQSNDFDQLGNELLAKVVEASNIDLNTTGQISFKTGANKNLSIKSAEASAKWREFYQTANKMTEIQKQQALANPDSTLSAIKRDAQRLSGMLNPIKGQLLESFLYAIGAALEEEAVNVAEASSTNLVVDMINKNLKNVIINGGQDLVKTQGGEQSTISVIIGDEFIKKIHSQGKVDVTVPSPFLDGTKWYASAKNYSSLRDVEILGNGSLIGLISESFIKPKESKYVYNAFSIPDSEWTSVNMHQLKQIFTIQALTGQKSNEIKANALVLSLNNLKKPIRVISTYALLNKIFENNKDFGSAVKFKPQLESLIPTGDKTARTMEPNNILNNMNISIALSKSVLSLKYIKNLT